MRGPAAAGFGQGGRTGRRGPSAAKAVLAAIAVLALAGCASPSPAAPAPVYGRIDGAVVDNALQPYGNLTVRLVELGRTDVTSRLGGFTFRDVPPGSYTIEAEAPGARPDRQPVDVTQDHTSRVILQLLHDTPARPFVTIQKNIGRADLAVPGETCTGCHWAADVVQRPDQVVVRAVWDSTLVAQDELTVLLRDAEGNAIATATGPSPLVLRVRGADMPATARLQLDFAFPDGFTPRPFDMESFLDVYYRPPTAA